MHVEDHPIEYGDFEGVIPEGEYGGGTVLLWDRGTWEPVEDAKKAYRDGALKFTLHGEKLKGKWMLVRKGGRRSDSDERHWFLFKERDEYAKPGFDIAAKKPLSVTSGRDLDEIAESADRVWGKNGEVKGAASKQVSAKLLSLAETDEQRRKLAGHAARPERLQLESGQRFRRLLKPLLQEKRPSLATPMFNLQRLQRKPRRVTAGFTRLSSTATGCFAELKAAKLDSSAGTERTGPPSFLRYETLQRNYRSTVRFLTVKS